jgi:hypothetical protein
MNEIVVCISKEVTGGNLTFGKKYNVIKRGRNPKFTNYIDSFLLINDIGIEMWYDKSPLIVEILPLKGYIKFIGEPSSGLTYGKCYEWLDKERDYEYVHLISDNNKFVGISKINYFGGAPNFVDVTTTEIRDKKLNSILD